MSRARPMAFMLVALLGGCAVGADQLPLGLGRESVNLDVTTSWPCLSSQFSWYATLKIIENTGCDDKACTMRTFCAYNKFSHNKTFVAQRDGWYVFLVEGSSAFDDEGDYTFTVKLTGKTAGCGC